MTSLVEVQTASPWLTLREAAARARCSTKSLVRAIATGALVAYRVGARRGYVLRPADIDRWILSRAVPVRAAARAR
jgi:excisionase family DNA binding protein